MVDKLKTGALSSLTVGAAAGYYGFHVLYGRDHWAAAIFLSLILAAGLISLFRVLAHGSGFLIAPQYDRFFRHRGLHIIVLSVGFVLGIGISASIPRHISFGLPEEKVIALQGTLLSDPRALSSGSGMAYLDLEKSAGRGGLRTSAKGKILVFFPEESIPALKEFGRGSGVYVEGSFKNQDNPLFSASAVHIIRPASALEQFRTGLRLEFTRRFIRGSAGAGGVVQNSWGGMALALLLGIRDNLDTDLARAYREAGSSYVLALSGMHLAVLSALIAFALRRPLGLKASSLLGALFIVLYVFLVGSQPSLDRAAIMYLLGALAVFGALPRNPASLLNLAFLVQIVRQNDSGIAISFILSYLALWGILHVGEAIHELWRGKIPEKILSPFTASLGAFITTAVVSVYYFGELRLIGIVAGLIIVPLTTVFMIGALLWLVLSFCLPVLTVPLGMGLSFLYRVLDTLVRLAARAPGLNQPGLFPVMTFFLGLSALVLYLGGRRRALRSCLAPLP
ncbi:competence protein ComEC [Spirochaetia bacterium]|nr:competence protein ComEC [Spirochaetia bacterium]